MQLNLKKPLRIFSSALLIIALAAVLNTGTSVTPAGAQDQTTQVDVRMRHCEDRPRANKRSALAYSKMGVSYCGVGGTLRSAKYHARKECKQRVPRNMRKKAPCEIISTDLEVLEPHLVDLLRQEVRVPIGLEIYDGDTEQKQTMNATLIYGEAIAQKYRRISVISEGGQQLCNGKYEITKRKFRFDLRCFDTYRFKRQKSRIDGYFLYKGIYAPVFAAKLKRNASYIQISPPVSTVN